MAIGEEIFEYMRSLRALGVKRAVFSSVFSTSGTVVTEVEFFPPEPGAIQAEAVAKALADLGPEEKMPSDTEMMMWSTGGPMPEVKATPPEDPTT